MVELILSIFETIALLSMIFLINLQNPVHSVFLLILVFANVGAVLLYLLVEFLALVYIIVYLGAIAVLFLFAVMMLNLKLSPISDKVYNYVPLGVLLTFILSTELTYVLSLTFSDLFYMDADYDSFISLLAEEHLVQLALILFLFLTMPFLIVALVLLIALIGAIVLTVSNNTDFRHQEVSEQLRASRLSIRSLP